MSFLDDSANIDSEMHRTTIEEFSDHLLSSYIEVEDLPTTGGHLSITQSNKRSLDQDDEEPFDDDDSSEEGNSLRPPRKKQAKQRSSKTTNGGASCFNQSTWKRNQSRLVGQHYPKSVPGKNPDGRLLCMVCKKRKSSIVCGICKVGLCTRGSETENCWYRFHFCQEF